MLENVNIDSVMTKYYHSICSDKLSEDRIDIDENLEVENSSTKYLQLFACFLNESYYKGYVLSNSIMKKLMDIIDYEGFEYQILEKYIDILNESMLDYKCDEDNRPPYKEFTLEPEESKDFIMEYLKVLNDEKYIYKSSEIPHFRHPESTKEDKPFDLVVLTEVEYPIDLMYKTIVNGNYTYDFYIENMKVIYDENINAYKALVKNNKSSLFFLLNYDDNKSSDVLIDNISSLPELANLIRVYDDYLFIITTDTSRVKYKFDDIVNNNIRRLIELLTINVSIEQTAMIIGLDFDLWKEYCDENYHELNTLLYAVNLYQSDPDRFKMINPVDFIFKIKECYPNDIYFYARTTLLSMDYTLFCNNFLDIFEELYNNLDKDTVKELFDECFTGFIALRNANVDSALMALDDKIMRLNAAFVDNNGTVIRYNGRELTNNIIDSTKKDIVLECVALFDITRGLLKRNGEFNPLLAPIDGDLIQAQYNYFEIDKSLLDNDIFIDDNNCITTGSKVIDVRSIQSMNPYVTLETKYLDSEFKLVNEDSAVYNAIYANYLEEYPESVNDDLLLVHDEDNKKLKISSKHKKAGTYLIGIMTPDSSFIYGNLLVDPNDSSVVGKLYNYYLQGRECISGAEKRLIEVSRESRDTYVSTYSNEYTNYRLIFTEYYDNFEDGKTSVVLV